MQFQLPHLNCLNFGIFSLSLVIDTSATLDVKSTFVFFRAKLTFFLHPPAERALTSKRLEVEN